MVPNVWCSLLYQPNLQFADLKFQFLFYFTNKSFTCGSGQGPAVLTWCTVLSVVCLIIIKHLIYTYCVSSGGAQAPRLQLYDGHTPGCGGQL